MTPKTYARVLVSGLFAAGSISSIDCSQSTLQELPDDSLRFVDASESRLPTGPLPGLSMDAEMFDMDSDGDLDIIIANEHRPNILLANDGS